MAIRVDNTNYNGEVLERILTVATTSNELVEKGLITPTCFHPLPPADTGLRCIRLMSAAVTSRPSGVAVQCSTRYFNRAIAYSVGASFLVNLGVARKSATMNSSPKAMLVSAFMRILQK